MKAPTYNFNFLIGKPYAVINFIEVGIREGSYYSHHGIVEIYADESHYSLRCIKDGRLYVRSQHVIFTDIGLARKAGEFIREIYSDN